jgi:hypothetical protein
MFIDIDDRGGRTSYAIDWASVGIGPIGLDGGTLAGGEIGWKDHQAVQAAEIEGQMFESYMEGLEESNFRNYYPLDRSEVRLGYLSNFVVYLDLQVLACTDVSFNSQLPARFGIPKDETFDEISKRLELFMPQFDEAVALARQI